ncbi:MAG: response regulator transcription factor [bacterium]|nr:response regulator transcription factor [bacterium]
MDKVLVVEDEELIRTMIKLNLEKSGYAVTCLQDAESLLQLVREAYYDLILLDVMLPGMSGEKALKKIREMGIKTPVIMATAKNDIDTKADSFEYGADDYIAKPFNMKELLMRVKAVIRRSRGDRVIPSHRIMKIGGFQVDLEKGIATGEAGTLTLSTKEVGLLTYFNTRPGQALSRADILEEVWGMDSDPTPRTIDNYIVKLRKMFEEDPENPGHFISVRSKGYRFNN